MAVLKENSMEFPKPKKIGTLGTIKKQTGFVVDIQE